LALGSGQKDSKIRSVVPSGRLWLLAALTASLAGDVLLLFPGYFVPGLVAFLLAHVAYLVLLRQGVGWFPSRGALAATMGVGAAMYAFLWTGGLPAGLRAPVAAYVTVIGLMAAQAIGRATVLRDKASAVVAVGACCFMLSDSLLATNKFVMPLPMAPFWVLSSYYAAQVLIVGGWMRASERTQGSHFNGSRTSSSDPDSESMKYPGSPQRDGA
jgi:uncharacterized membrane protein YhhN